MYGHCGPLVEVNVLHFRTTLVKVLPNGQEMEVKNTENDMHPGSDHPQLAQKGWLGVNILEKTG